MTPSDQDLEITAALAKFMGWPEAVTYNDFEDTTIWPERGLHWSRAVAAGKIIISGGEQKPEEWQPLTRPDHASRVMAEAARRGLEVRTRMTAHFSLGSVWKIDIEQRLVDRIGVHREPAGSNPGASWCRAVCFAVVEAIEKAGLQ